MMEPAMLFGCSVIQPILSGSEVSLVSERVLFDGRKGSARRSLIHVFRVLPVPQEVLKLGAPHTGSQRQLTWWKVGNGPDPGCILHYRAYL